MNKIKLCIFCHYSLYPIAGGLEKSLVSFLSNMDYNKFDVTLVTTYPRIHDVYLNLIPKSVKLVHLLDEKILNYKPTPRYKNPKFIYSQLGSKIISRKILKLIDMFDIVIDYEPFIVIKHLMMFNVYPKSKIIAWHHNDFQNLLNDFILKFNKSYHKIFFNYVDEILFVNNISRNELESSRIDKAKTKMHTVYNGMDFEKIQYNSSLAIDKDYLKLFNTNYILMVARLDDQKDHETLIKAFSKIKIKFSDYNLIFCGAGKKLLELNNLCKSLGLESCVHFLGAIANPYVWIKNSKCFVLSTNYEGLPIVVNEAMLLNKPIVVSNIPTCLESINYNKCGFSFPVGDIDALVLLLEKIINKDYDEKILIDNQNKFIQQFDIKTTSKILENILISSITSD